MYIKYTLKKYTKRKYVPEYSQSVYKGKDLKI